MTGPERLVVGAGLSGLYAALLLARAGRRVRVVERAAHAGGLAAAETFRGIPCDLGSHRLHPDALERPLFRELNATTPFLSRPRRGVLLLGRNKVPYPPTTLPMMRALGPMGSLSLAAGLLTRSGQRRAFTHWDRNRPVTGEDTDLGFEDFVVARVGRRTYHTFYEPYARKVWGLDPSELSQIVAKKRLSASRPWSFLRSAVGRAADWVDGGVTKPAPTPLDRYVYPAKGTASIIAWLKAEARRAGVRIDYDTPFDPTEPRQEPVLFSGDLGDLVPTPLEHRGLYLVYLALPIDRLSDVETYYAPEPRHWFGRVAELSNYSPELHRDGETTLCVEIPEGTWGKNASFAGGPQLDELMAQLTSAGIVPAGVRPLEARQRFVRNVYPLYRRGWLAKWRATMAEVVTRGNVVPFGRQALFLHCNLDHCADIASDAVAHVEAGRSVTSWVDRAERYLELRVRD